MKKVKIIRVKHHLKRMIGNFIYRFEMPAPHKYFVTEDRLTVLIAEIVTDIKDATFEALLEPVPDNLPEDEIFVASDYIKIISSKPLANFLLELDQAKTLVSNPVSMDLADDNYKCRFIEIPRMPMKYKEV